jgi:hypothetical protein
MSPVRTAARVLLRRPYATVERPLLVAKPPPPPPPSSLAPATHSAVDRLVTAQLASSSSATSLPTLISQYLDRAGHVLPSYLPYEPAPDAHRRVRNTVADAGVHLVAHVVKESDRTKVTVASGFAIHISDSVDPQSSVFVSCAHTLEEVHLESFCIRTIDSAFSKIRWSPLLVSPQTSLSSEFTQSTQSSGSFILTPQDITSASSSPINSASGGTARAVCTPVSSILSALHRSDLLLLSAAASVRSLPVSPYPAQPGTRIRAHIVSESRPITKSDPEAEGWHPWVGGWAKWILPCGTQGFCIPQFARHELHVSPNRNGPTGNGQRHEFKEVTS